ncbi:kappa-type opioid receptor-like [Patiria miniata]|uniref:G-protein coupled receptors family 1 profile domain-containing protein n=1 Tax=Patiria miniata TaxID=46514 RepID=A0A913ZRI3_PATMI|nr:kappa-type opioid receptor-like [Patiria miniata]
MNASSEQRTDCTPEHAQLVLTSDNISSYTYSSGDTTVICVVMPIILAIGVLGNGTFLFVVARVNWMRQVSTNIYLACLALVDITFIAMAVGGKLSRFLASPIVTDESLLGVPGCVLLYFVSDLCFYVSLFLITLVSLGRYSAVCQPFAFRSSSEGRKGVMSRIAWCWGISAAAACILIPDRLVWEETCITLSPPDEFHHLPQVIGSCTSVVEWYFNFSNFVQVAPFFTTMFVNFTLYALIIRKLRQQAEMRQGLSNETALEQAQVRDNITRMLIVNGTSYFVFLMPFEALALGVTIKSLSGTPSLLTKDQFSLALNICRCLLYTNSAVNPFIYTLMSPAYRRAFADALCPASTSQGASVQDLIGMSNINTKARRDSERRQH